MYMCSMHTSMVILKLAEPQSFHISHWTRNYEGNTGILSLTARS